MNLIQVENIKLVQVDIDANAQESQEVLIDSRVYCRDVIKVNHSDWIQNVLYKYQNYIEQRFGILRFASTKTQNDVKRGRPTKYALMTRKQTNFLLLLSNNDPAVLDAKAQLIEEFDQALKWRTEYLERQLNATASTPNNTESQQREQWIAELEQENKTLKEQIEELKQKSGNEALKQLKILKIVEREYKGICKVNSELEQEVNEYKFNVTALAQENKKLKETLENQKHFVERAKNITEDLEESLKNSVRHYRADIMNQLSYLLDVDS